MRSLAASTGLRRSFRWASGTLIALRRLDRFVYRQIRARRQGGESDDLLSMLLSSRDPDGRPISDRQVRDEIMTFVGAGYETTALTLCYSLYQLSRNPAARAGLEAEIDEVLGGGRRASRISAGSNMRIRC